MLARQAVGQRERLVVELAGHELEAARVLGEKGVADGVPERGGRRAQLAGGQATADAIPGARLIGIPGMGHDLPRQVWPQLVDAVAETAARASATQAA